MLTNDDVKKINDLSLKLSTTDEMGNFDDTKRYVFVDPLGSTSGEGAIFEDNLNLFNSSQSSYKWSNYTDNLGHIRVLRLY